MKRSYVLLVVGFVGLTTLLPAAPAEHCEEPYLDRDTYEVTLYENNYVWVRVLWEEVNEEPEQPPYARYYLDVDPCGYHWHPSHKEQGCNVFLYEETNGIINLQRDDRSGADDTCHGMIAPDTRMLP